MNLKFDVRVQGNALRSAYSSVQVSRHEGHPYFGIIQTRLCQVVLMNTSHSPYD